MQFCPVNSGLVYETNLLTNLGVASEAVSLEMNLQMTKLSKSDQTKGLEEKVTLRRTRCQKREMEQNTNPVAYKNIKKADRESEDEMERRHAKKRRYLEAKEENYPTLVKSLNEA